MQVKNWVLPSRVSNVLFRGIKNPQGLTTLVANIPIKLLYVFEQFLLIGKKHYQSNDQDNHIIDYLNWTG